MPNDIRIVLWVVAVAAIWLGLAVWADWPA